MLSLRQFIDIWELLITLKQIILYSFTRTQKIISFEFKCEFPTSTHIFYSEITNTTFTLKLENCEISLLSVFRMLLWNYRCRYFEIDFDSGNSHSNLKCIFSESELRIFIFVLIISVFLGKKHYTNNASLFWCIKYVWWINLFRKT